MLRHPRPLILLHPQLLESSVNILRWISLQKKLQPQPATRKPHPQQPRRRQPQHLQLLLLSLLKQQSTRVEISLQHLLLHANRILWLSSMQ